MANQSSSLSLVDALVQLSFLIQSTLASLAREYDVSIVQARLIGILRDRKATMTDLAQYLELEKSSVTGLIDRAEQKGLVKRIADTDDLRSTRVTLTFRGQTLANTIGKRMAHEVAEITGALSEAQRRQLTQLTNHVIATC